MRAELISLRSRAKEQQSGERLTTFSLVSGVLWARWDLSLVSLVEDEREYFHLVFHHSRLSFHESQWCLSCPNWLLLTLKKRRLTGQSPQSAGGSFNHWKRLWKLLWTWSVLPLLHWRAGTLWFILFWIIVCTGFLHLIQTADHSSHCGATVWASDRCSTPDTSTTQAALVQLQLLSLYIWVSDK